MTCASEHLYRGMVILIEEEDRVWEAEVRCKGVLLADVQERSHGNALREAKRRIDLMLDKPK